MWEIREGLGHSTTPPPAGVANDRAGTFLESLSMPDKTAVEWFEIAHKSAMACLPEVIEVERLSTVIASKLESARDALNYAEEALLLLPLAEQRAMSVRLNELDKMAQEITNLIPRARR